MKVYHYQYCRSLGGKLAEFDNQAQYDAAIQFINQKDPAGTQWYWIGLTDLSVEGTFRWQSTGQVASYTNWATTQPDNDKGTEDCVHIWSLALGRKMNDFDCTATGKQALCMRGEIYIIKVTVCLCVCVSVLYRWPHR